MNDDRSISIAAEVGLLVVTLSAVLGMHRLFATNAWMAPLVVHAVAAHLVAAGLRRRGLGLGAAAVVMAGAAALVASWTSYWSTTTVGIPTGTTVSAMRTDLSDAWTLYKDVVAPAPVQTGFVLASALAIWCVAYVADWAAFRLWVPFEATLPAGTLFLFTSLLGEDRGQAGATALYGGALLAFLLVHRVARQEVASHWVSEDRALGRRSLLVAGGTLGVIAVLAGTVIGPNLPGADSPGVLDPRDLDEEDDARVTVSPLVDIRSRLVEQSNQEVFTVRSDGRAYWRLTSLERFNGTIWSSSGSYGEADDDLPEAVRTDVEKQAIEQSYTIKALAAIWLPSAYEARSFRTEGETEARYDEESSTLIVDNSVPTSDGLTYQVTSAAPRFDAAQLAADDDPPPDDIADTYLDLPDGFSPKVRELAEQLTSGQATPFDQAVAIQNHLRGFTYSLDVQPGHSGDLLERFLFATQTGYCEQFAGAFAAMARSVGLPARVAVGFTPGEADPADPTLFTVRGEHAHAWPEVYFEGAGWVPFEPTPGRGIPSAEPYTGVPEEQAAAGQPNQSETPVTAPTPTTTPSDGDPTGEDAATDTTLEPEPAPGTGGGAGDDPLVERFVTDPAKRAIPWLLIGAAAYGIGVPALLVLQRRRRRHQAVGDQAQIALAWAEASEEAELVGFAPRPSDTYAERARALADIVPGAGDEALHLARLVEGAHYTPDGAAPGAVAEAWTDSDAVRATARGLAPWTTRLGRWFDPRPPLRAWRDERSARQRRITTLPTGDRELERVLVGVGGPTEAPQDPALPPEDERA